MEGGRMKRVGHWEGGRLILYDRRWTFFTTSYGRPVQRPSKMSFAFCSAAKIPIGSDFGVPSGWKCAGDASSKSGMFCGAWLFNALKAISSGYHGPVNSRPGFFVGCASFGIGTSSLSRQDRKSTRLNSSHSQISYAVFCLKKKTANNDRWVC